MTGVWLAVLGGALGCYLLKLAGLSLPTALVEPPVMTRVGDLIPVALLAALVTVQVFAGPEGSLTLDARLAGLAFAVVALWRRASFLVVVVGAAITAALVRLIA